MASLRPFTSRYLNQPSIKDIKNVLIEEINKLKPTEDSSEDARKLHNEVLNILNKLK